MTTILRVMLMLVLLAGSAVAAPLPLQRGVNIHEWLNWSPLDDEGNYRWPPYRSVAEWLAGGRSAEDWPATDPLADIRALGFDYVRLTVDPGPLLASEGDRRREALAVLADAVRQLNAADLRVVFNLHSVSQLPQYGMDVVNGPAGSEAVAGYSAMVADVARMLAPLGAGRVAIEPYNEPAHYPCDASGSEDWQEIMTATVAAIRAVSSELTIVATGGCGGSVTGLTDIKPTFDDPNLLYSFHMYEPHSFTHQRSDIEGDFASGLPWPASAGSAELTVEMLKAHMMAAGLSEAEQARNLSAVGGAIEEYFAEDWGEAQVTARIGEAVDWAEANGIPSERLFMGEFGAILMSADGRMGAFNADRLRYLTAVRAAAEANGIPWAIWEYANPYGMSVIAPSGPAVPDREMLGALGL
ncbi:glycoside hydrolase family 5 [Devosia insulae DS-56]|uniref:Glycoside hydrolase family 5 n=1 Tax=Devosia insulae DS-56 TaxID=1116389 RepID=A0A1E5XJW9_9HYPH|nr:cellulase family glycosylhydrolase [Devosia insulae]OEO28890.1 glycoside hydrolase family 5 [Devosia insulae DS-56]